MTDEQILELAKTCAIFSVEDNSWECFEEDLLKFAREMYRKGKYDGYESGYDDGCYEATGGQ